VGVYLDLAKAFDIVSHEKLLRTLYKAGINVSLLDWFASYLNGRRHRVRIEGVCSENLISAWGTFQGSVLGPLLFVIYINNRFALPLKASVMGYADDTSLLYSVATREESERDYEHDRKILFPWLHNELLHFNRDKCKYVIHAYKTPPVCGGLLH